MQMHWLILVSCWVLLVSQAGVSARGLAALGTASPPSEQQAALDAVNTAIAAQAEAAVAGGKAAEWLVAFRVPEQQVEAQIRIASQSTGVFTGADLVARQQVYAGYKSRVLDAVATATTVSTERGNAATEPQQQVAIQVVTDYDHLPITFVRISSPDALARLRADPNVLSVSPNGIVRIASRAPWEQIGFPAVADKGFLGKGSSVVVIDTGLDYTRSVFGPCTAPGQPAATCKVIYSQDIIADDGTLDEGTMHGTNVAGIVAETAPEAKLIGLDVFDGDDASYSDVITAIEWSVANRDKYNITVINMSLGGGGSATNCDSVPISMAVNTAYAAGVLSACASGNNGFSSKLLVPACASKAVSVGAVYSVDLPVAAVATCTDQNVKAGDVTCFSNSASFLTILAPGYNITAAGVTQGGTSQATPFVSAAIALLKDKHPTYTPAQIVSVLKSTGVPTLDKRNGITTPRLNLRTALGVSCAPRVLPRFLKVANTGGSFTMTVSPPSADCSSWTVSMPAPSWMRVVGPTSGTGKGSITVQVDAMTGTAARSMGLTAAANNSTSVVSISQAVLSAGALGSDLRPPVLGRVQGSSSNGAVTLGWPVAKDADSGVSSYQVVYNKGGTPPHLQCTTGTVVAATPTQGASGMTVTVQGLTVGLRHTFRVCALDAAGNVSPGRMWRGTVY